MNPGPAIDAASEFLASQIEDEPAALAFGYMLHRRFGLGSFADAPERYDALLAEDPTKDSAPKGAVRLFRRLVAVDSPFEENDVRALTTDWDRVTVRALHCDQQPLPADYAEQLGREVARGGYHLTHAGIALLWLRDNGCSWPMEEDAVGALVDDLAATVAGESVGDVAYEAAGVLRYLGHGNRVPSDFANRILEAQNEDGGWAFDEARPGSHWHPTLLAQWVLLEEAASAKLDRFVPQADGAAPVPTPTAAHTGSPKAWTDMVRSEERLLALTPDLQRLAHATRNLELPGDRARGAFANTVTVVDIDAPGAFRPWAASISAETLSFAPGARADVPRDDLRLWTPLLDQVERLDEASFHMVRGDFLNGNPGLFEAEVSFEALAKMGDGSTGWIRASVTVVWEEADDLWRIVGWRTDSLDLVRVPRALFSEVLPASLRDDALLEQARHSGHDEVVRQYLADPDRKGSDFFPPAMDEHPGIAVVDLNRDGFDDLYVMPHWGTNLMLQNRGDGTFEEVGAAVGLDVHGNTAAAVFADFDNDGDPDVMMARTGERSLYLRNDQGRFRNASADVVGELPALASSVTAVDIDDDGLLDVYFSTYAARRLTSEYFSKKSGERPPLLGGFVEASASKQILEKMEAGSQIYDFPGPPNVHLRNIGEGRFEVVNDSPLAILANTYQATWADYDADGDSDVYLANDFAPNHLLRNAGQGRFDDVTDETGTADVGFGMGATWGDVDGDTREDLYVSNMYSKAGRRITAKLASIDPRFPKMARGNTLFRNEGDRFRDLSQQSGDRHGQKAGWSWGGQLVDVDNDGRLDLHVLSGYYTAPREFELPVDT